MAKRNNDPPSGGDKAKVRVFFAEVEGNNDSVREALRTMVSAMGRPAARAIPAKANGEPAVLTHEPDEDGVEDVWGDDDVVEQASDPAPNGRRRPRGAGPKTDRNAGIALVHDLNFRPEGHPTLREFFSGKSPNTDMEEILVAVYYMQHLMGLSQLGLGHIRTALNDVGKSIPLDLRQTLRNMRGKKAWVKYTELDNITTATAGDNHVLHDMGKKA